MSHIRPLKLGKDFKAFDGKTEFRVWLHAFEFQMKMNAASEAVKLSTINTYLSADIINWLSGLDYESIDSCNKLTQMILTQ